MNWLLVPTSAGTPSYSSPAVVSAYNNYTITNQKTGACLDSTGGAYGIATAVNSCNGAANQLWQARQGGTSTGAWTTFFLLSAGTGAGAAPSATRPSQPQTVPAPCSDRRLVPRRPIRCFQQWPEGGHVRVQLDTRADLEPDAARDCRFCANAVRVELRRCRERHHVLSG